MNAETIKRLRAACALFLLVLVAAPAIPAQSGGSYQITSSVIAGGGGDSSGGSFSLSATIGQAVTAISNGAAYVLSGGFWASECPVITVSPATLPAATLNNFYAQQLTSAGGFGSSTYALTGALPNGVTLSGDTLSGTPTQSGVFPLVVTATDANGCKGQTSYTLTVNVGGPATFESDVAPRPNGNGAVSATDVTQTRRFVAGLDTAAIGSEFQRADAAPRTGGGNGSLSATDITQARRYAAALDALTLANGPNAPGNGPAVAAPHGGGNPPRTVRVVSQTVTPGSQVVVPVELDSGGDEVALSFSLTYNPAILSLNGDQTRIAAGTGLPAGTTLTRNVSQDAAGRIGIVVDSATPFTAGARQVVTITFNVAGSLVTSPVGFGDQPVVRDISDDQAQSLTAIYLDGTVGVTAPTAAHIQKYDAYRFDNGNLVRWHSSWETNNLGFYVYRQDNTNNLVRLTPELLAGSALSFGGAQLSSGYDYSWWDAPGSADAVYWIEDVDLNGKRSMHGPVRVTDCGLLNAECAVINGLRPQSSPTLGALSTANANASFVREYPQAARKSLNAPASLLPNPQAGVRSVKIAVRQAGLHRVNGQQLLASGLEENANARFLQLYADGTEIPLNVFTESGREDGPLGANGIIEFYGTGRDTRETDTRTYWLIAGNTPGLRIGPPARVAPRGGRSEGKGDGETALPDSALSTQSSALSFAYTVERKDRTIYFAALSNGEETENFFGAVITQTASPQTLRVAKLDSSATAPATLAVALQGATDDAHQVRVQLNGQTLGEITFNGQTRQTARFSFVQSALQEGDNTVTLQAATAGDVSLTDYLRLTYARRYEAENDLLFATGSRNGLTVNGFTTADARVFDVTNPARPYQLAARSEAVANGYALRVDGNSQNRALLAITANRALTPAAVTRNELSDWTNPAHAYEFLILAPRAWHSAVSPLAERRAAQGLRTAVVALEDVYDEFSNGDKNVNAIRAFLRQARTRWAAAPQYVLFVGDASYDPRNYLGLGDQDVMPTGYVNTFYLETSSDESLADFDGDGVGEMSIGRLPARNPAQAQLMVNKILGFTPHLSDGALLVSDRPEGYDFVAMNQAVRALLPAQMPATFINRAANPDAANRTAIVNAFNQGPALVNYAGHGSVEVWTGAPIFNAADAQNLTNTRLPVVVAMNCLNGYFHDLNTVSLAESLMRAPHGGAVAVWASSALTPATGQIPANQEMARQLFQHGARLGDAARAAKQTTNDPEVRRTWLLFGDPTLALL